MAKFTISIESALGTRDRMSRHRVLRERPTNPVEVDTSNLPDNDSLNRLKLNFNPRLRHDNCHQGFLMTDKNEP